MGKPLSECSKEELIEIIKNQKSTLACTKKFGLVWEEKSEKVVTSCKQKLPVVKEVVDKAINKAKDSEPTNIIIEGDNYHALSVLNYTHANRIDVIYIDPPYNRGKNDFMYDDSYVEKEDSYKHSKWLSFMDKRLRIAKNLLSPEGVIIVNIDEHESCRLLCLLEEIFGEQNNIGEIIWNKQNPKGDSHGVACMHETIYCFCKNRDEFFKRENVCIRKKPNSEAMINKAQALFKKIGKHAIPDDVAAAIKPFNYDESIKKDFYVTYDLGLINKEFQNWLSKQPFSGGEKAYKYIDETGRLYRGVSMAWPNKKKAPDDYFTPLIHPITQKPCPVPERGWRNPPSTMKDLLHQNLIIFGEDETKQPERKYFLDENLYENVPSIYENADSADAMFSAMRIHFDYPKPVSEAIYVCSNIQPNAITFLDFFAGSGTTGHAVMEMNAMDGGHRQFILCTNNENNIAEEVTYPRINSVINGYSDGKTQIAGIPTNVRYFKTEFIDRNDTMDRLRRELSPACEDMIRIREGAYEKIINEDMLKVFKSSRGLTAIIYDRFELAEHIQKIEALNTDAPVHLYVFSYSKSDRKDEMPDNLKHKYEAQPIPEGVLEIYKKIFANIKGGKNA